MEMVANTAKIENDGYCTVLAFADDPVNPKNYAILQITNKPSPEDVRLGQDGIHFELGGSDLVGYGLLQAIRLANDGIHICLNEVATAKAGMDRELLIRLTGASIDGQTPAQVVDVFQKRLPHDE
jgi:hypothetical protein